MFELADERILVDSIVIRPVQGPVEPTLHLSEVRAVIFPLSDLLPKHHRELVLEHDLGGDDIADEEDTTGDFDASLVELVFGLQDSLLEPLSEGHSGDRDPKAQAGVVDDAGDELFEVVVPRLILEVAREAESLSDRHRAYFRNQPVVDAVSGHMSIFECLSERGIEYMKGADRISKETYRGGRHIE